MGYVSCGRGEGRGCSVRGSDDGLLLIVGLWVRLRQVMVGSWCWRSRNTG